MSIDEQQVAALAWQAMPDDEKTALVRDAGCTCPVPLLGWRPFIGPRCRMCGTVCSCIITHMTDRTVDEQRTDAVELVEDHPGVEHLWLNAVECLRPSDEYAAKLGHAVIEKVMAHRHGDVFKRRHIVLRINAS